MDMAIFNDLAEGADDVGLGLEVHRQIGIIPVADHPQTLEIDPLLVHLLGGIAAAGNAKFSGAHLGPRFAHLLLHLELDRQTMAVPAGDIGGIKTVEAGALDDNILEHLVHCMTDMNLTVGVGRAIMKDKFRPAGRGLANHLIEVHLLPLLEHQRLTVGQVSLHRESGLGEIEGTFIISHGLLPSSG